MKEKLNLLTRELDFDLRKIQLSNLIVFLAIVVPPPHLITLKIVFM